MREIKSLYRPVQRQMPFGCVSEKNSEDVDEKAIDLPRRYDILVWLHSPGVSAALFWAGKTPYWYNETLIYTIPLRSVSDYEIYSTSSLLEFGVIVEAGRRAPEPRSGSRELADASP